MYNSLILIVITFGSLRVKLSSVSLLTLWVWLC
jgi:hypothetical protein